MKYPAKKTEVELSVLYDSLLAKDERWATSLWELTFYLVNIQFAQRRLVFGEEKGWDAATEIYCQLKQRIDCKARTNKDGTVTTPTPIENIVSYVYFALPKRFIKWCSTVMTSEEREKTIIHLDEYNLYADYDCDSDKMKPSKYLCEKLSVTPTEDETPFSEVEKTVIEWLGKATNNIDLKNRRAKIKAAGYEVIDGHLVQIEMSEKEMARELAILESKKEDLPSNEERRMRRIKYLKGKLYGKE